LRALVDRAPMPVRWFIVDAGAITDIDYSAAQSMRDLLDDLARQRVGMVFARVSRHLRSDMDRHHITAAIGETRIFTTLHEATDAVRAAARFGAHKSDESYQIEAGAAPALLRCPFKLRVF
jgi:SulP family sulfate permease